MLDGVTFSGGDPFCQAEPLAYLGKQIKSLGLNIVSYTGYDFEELYNNRSLHGWGKLLEVTDILIDGKFVQELRDWNIKFRGSSNQRYINCQASLKEGRAVEIEP